MNESLKNENMSEEMKEQLADENLPDRNIEESANEYTSDQSTEELTDKEKFDQELTSTQSKIYAIRDTIFFTIIWLIMIFVRIKATDVPMYINGILVMATVFLLFNYWVLFLRLKK